MAYDDDFDPNEDYVDATPRTTSITNKDFRAMRAAVKERDKLQAEIAQLRRESAMREAGIPSTPQGKLFLKAYDGDVTDPAQVRAAAIEYGIISDEGSADPAAIARQQALYGSQQAVAAQTGASPQGSMAAWDQLMAEAAKSNDPKQVAKVLQSYSEAQGMDEKAFSSMLHKSGF